MFLEAFSLGCVADPYVCFILSCLLVLCNSCLERGREGGGSGDGECKSGEKKVREREGREPFCSCHFPTLPLQLTNIVCCAFWATSSLTFRRLFFFSRSIHFPKQYREKIISRGGWIVCCSLWTLRSRGLFLVCMC